MKIYKTINGIVHTLRLMWIMYFFPLFLIYLILIASWTDF